MKKLHITTDKNIKVCINYKDRADGSVRISGYLVDAKTGIRNDLDIESYTTAKCASQVPDKEKYLIGRLMKAYKEKVTGKPTVELTDQLYTQAFLTLTEKQRQELCPVSWQAKRTRDQALSYFRKTMLPILDEYGAEIDAIQRNEIVQKIRENCLSSKNSKGNPRISEMKVARHLYEFNSLYGALRSACPEFALPEIELPPLTGVKNIQTEQCKALPERVIIRLAAALMQLIPNGLALGGILMMTAMLRTAEACAPRFCDIVFFSSYAVYCVLGQIDDKGNFTAYLKSDDSYRNVVLPKFALDAILARKAYLRRLGYTDEQIETMPVVSAADDCEKAALPNDLSSYLRRLISAISHCGDDFWRAVNALMREEVDLESDGSPSKDPSAYVLRRNACSVLCNFCGMFADLVDALMGHKLSKFCKESWKEYIRRPGNWSKIAEYMEHFVYDPAHSAHPAFAPIQIGQADDRTMLPYTAFKLEVAEKDGDVELTIAVSSCEPNDEVFVRTSSEIISVTPIPMPTCAEENTIIGFIHDREFYQKEIDAVKALDLSAFYPERKEKDNE